MVFSDDICLSNQHVVMTEHNGKTTRAMKRRVWLQLTLRLLIGTTLSVAIGSFVLLLFVESFFIVPVFLTAISIATLLSAAGVGFLDFLCRKILDWNTIKKAERE